MRPPPPRYMYTDKYQYLSIDGGKAQSWDQGWRSGENTHLLPLWLVFQSWVLHMMLYSFSHVGAYTVDRFAISKRRPTCCNILKQPNVCNMLCMHNNVALFALDYCVRLVSSLATRSNNVTPCCVEMLRAFGRTLKLKIKERLLVV